MPSKRFYAIAEVSEMLDIPATTLRYWEDVFPMFNPNRLPSGRRRFNREDVKMAEKIKELLYTKGLKIDAAIEMMNKTYRKSRPHPPRPCKTAQRAITLLGEASEFIENKHALSRIKAVMGYLNTLGDGGAKTD